MYLPLSLAGVVIHQINIQEDEPCPEIIGAACSTLTSLTQPEVSMLGTICAVISKQAKQNRAILLVDRKTSALTIC